MADQITYVFNDVLPYVTDTGFVMDWSGKYNIWAGFDFDDMATIATAIGAVPYTSANSPKFVNDLDQKRFNGRKAIFKFTDAQGINGRIELILPNPDTQVTIAAAAMAAIEALGVEVNRVDIVGEVWLDIYDLLAPPTKTLVSTPKFNARKRYNNRISYQSNLGLTYTEKVSIQSDVNGLIPSGLASSVIALQTVVGSPLSNETGRPKPRHFVVTTQYTDEDGNPKFQKTKVNCTSTDRETLSDGGELLAGLPSSNKLNYYGECVEKVETLFPVAP